ncbi:MAG: hypothetical protein M1837_005469 [Sclerophora amabilis]|nr:MAG: hypothetical protein M1837_005469 [Sclerophora amabilis]
MSGQPPPRLEDIKEVGQNGLVLEKHIWQPATPVPDIYRMSGYPARPFDPKLRQHLLFEIRKIFYLEEVYPYGFSLNNDIVINLLRKTEQRWVGSYNPRQLDTGFWYACYERHHSPDRFHYREAYLTKFVDAVGPDAKPSFDAAWHQLSLGGGKILEIVRERVAVLNGDTPWRVFRDLPLPGGTPESPFLTEQSALEDVQRPTGTAAQEGGPDGSNFNQEDIRPTDAACSPSAPRVLTLRERLYLARVQKSTTVRRNPSGSAVDHDIQSTAPPSASLSVSSAITTTTPVSLTAANSSCDEKSDHNETTNEFSAILASPVARHPLRQAMDVTNEQALPDSFPAETIARDQNPSPILCRRLLDPRDGVCIHRNPLRRRNLERKRQWLQVSYAGGKKARRMARTLEHEVRVKVASNVGEEAEERKETASRNEIWKAEKSEREAAKVERKARTKARRKAERKARKVSLDAEQNEEEKALKKEEEEETDTAKALLEWLDRTLDDFSSESMSETEEAHQIDTEEAYGEQAATDSAKEALRWLDNKPGLESASQNESFSQIERDEACEEEDLARKKRCIC